jgi:hypothetical protein
MKSTGGQNGFDSPAPDAQLAIQSSSSSTIQTNIIAAGLLNMMLEMMNLMTQDQPHQPQQANNPDFNSNSSIAQRLEQLTQEIPQITHYLLQAITIAEDCPEAHQLSACMSILWENSPKNLQESLILLCIGNTNNIANPLKRFISHLDPNTEDTQHILMLINAIKAQRNSLIQQWQQLQRYESSF